MIPGLSDASPTVFFHFLTVFLPLKALLAGGGKLILKVFFLSVAVTHWQNNGKYVMV
jgi:hypothetical protein